MKIYNVIVVGGDYIGYFEIEQCYSFLNFEDATKKHNDIISTKKNTGNRVVEIVESDVKFGDGESGHKCGVCDGNGLSNYNYACPACGGSGMSGI